MPAAWSRAPSAAVASWLLAPPATTFAFSAAIDCFGQDRAERVGADARPPRVPGSSADTASPPSSVGERRLGPSTSASVNTAPPPPAAGRARRRPSRRPGSRRARPSCLSLPSARFAAALTPKIHAERGVGPGSPPAAPLSRASPATKLRSPRDHVMSAPLHADILGGDVAAAERLDRAPERVQHVAASWCRPRQRGSPPLPPPNGSPAIAFL